MKTNIVFLGLVFTSIIMLSIFVNTIENFDSPDSVLDTIQKLKFGFESLKKETSNISVKTIDTPKGPTAVSEVIDINITNISTLEKTYNEMINGPQKYDLENIKNTIQKSNNELIERYNYIVKTLNIKLPDFKDLKLPLLGIKTATDVAISTTKVDPVLIAIQTVQDGFIALKDEIIRSGSRMVSTPTGDVSALKMAEENIAGINNLTEKYQSMIRDKISSPDVKKYVQKNLNIFITTYNYIIISLNLRRQLFTKDMITMTEVPTNKPAILDPIPGLEANKILSIPLAKIVGSQPLITQMSTHGLDAPPNLIKSNLNASVPSIYNYVKPVKPYSKTHLYDKLNQVYDVLPTQNSMIE